MVLNDKVEHIKNTYQLERNAENLGKCLGSKTHHAFTSKENKLLMKTLPNDQNNYLISENQPVLPSSTCNLNPGMFVTETGDVDVSFRKQEKMCFMWLQRKDRWWVPKRNVFCPVYTLVVQGHATHSCRNDSDEFKPINIYSTILTNLTMLLLGHRLMFL